MEMEREAENPEEHSGNGIAEEMAAAAAAAAPPAQPADDAPKTPPPAQPPAQAHAASDALSSPAQTASTFFGSPQMSNNVGFAMTPTQVREMRHLLSAHLGHLGSSRQADESAYRYYVPVAERMAAQLQPEAQAEQQRAQSGANEDDDAATTATERMSQAPAMSSPLKPPESPAVKAHDSWRQELNRSVDHGATHFTGVRITDPLLIRLVEYLQSQALEQFPYLRRTVTPPRCLVIPLNVVSLTDEQQAECKGMLRCVGEWLQQRIFAKFGMVPDPFPSSSPRLVEVVNRVAAKQKLEKRLVKIYDELEAKEGSFALTAVGVSNYGRSSVHLEFDPDTLAVKLLKRLSRFLTACARELGFGVLSAAFNPHVVILRQPERYAMLPAPLFYKGGVFGDRNVKYAIRKVAQSRDASALRGAEEIQSVLLCVARSKTKSGFYEVPASLDVFYRQPRVAFKGAYQIYEYLSTNDLFFQGKAFARRDVQIGIDSARGGAVEVPLSEFTPRNRKKPKNAFQNVLYFRAGEEILWNRYYRFDGVTFSGDSHRTLRRIPGLNTDPRYFPALAAACVRQKRVGDRLLAMERDISRYSERFFDKLVNSTRMEPHEVQRKHLRGRDLKAPEDNPPKSVEQIFNRLFWDDDFLQSRNLSRLALVVGVRSPTTGTLEIPFRGFKKAKVQLEQVQYIRADREILFNKLTGFDGVFYSGVTPQLLEQVPDLATNLHYMPSVVVQRLALKEAQEITLQALATFKKSIAQFVEKQVGDLENALFAEMNEESGLQNEEDDEERAHGSQEEEEKAALAGPQTKGLKLDEDEDLKQGDDKRMP